MSLLLMAIPWRPRKPSSCSSTDSVSSSNAAFSILCRCCVLLHANTIDVELLDRLLSDRRFVCIVLNRQRGFPNHLFSHIFLSEVFLVRRCLSGDLLL